MRSVQDLCISAFPDWAAVTVVILTRSTGQLVGLVSSEVKSVYYTFTLIDCQHYGKTRAG